MKYRKKPVIVEAVQWFKTGDHPAVEGYRAIAPSAVCSRCHHQSRAHGVIAVLHYVVCPGDWIITDGQLTPYPCKPDVFELTYEPVEG